MQPVLVTQDRSVSSSDFPKEMRRHFSISLLGIVLNLLVTFFIFHFSHFHYLWAYLIGALANIGVSTGLRKIFLSRFMQSLNIPYGKLIGFYSLLAVTNMILAWFVVERMGWPPGSVIVSLILLASLMNTILVGLWAFVCFPIAEVIYEELNGEFFDDMVNDQKVGAFRAWVHRSRFKMTREFVERYYRPQDTLVDFAAGSCGWNTQGLPVIGLDVNQKMLDYGVQRGRLKAYRVGDITQSPFETHSADVAVSSQVFEHLRDPRKALREIRRVLKPGGIFIIDVPYDLFLGPHFLLFNIHCFIQGYLRRSELYRQRCGHLNHFTLKILKEFLESEHFKVEEIKLCNLLTVHAAARLDG